jgi:hypothetical protein
MLMLMLMVVVLPLLLLRRRPRTVEERLLLIGGSSSNSRIWNKRSCSSHEASCSHIHNNIGRVVKQRNETWSIPRLPVGISSFFLVSSVLK